MKEHHQLQVFSQSNLKLSWMPLRSGNEKDGCKNPNGAASNKHGFSKLEQHAELLSIWHAAIYITSWAAAQRLEHLCWKVWTKNRPHVSYQKTSSRQLNTCSRRLSSLRAESPTQSINFHKSEDLRIKSCMPTPTTHEHTPLDTPLVICCVRSTLVKLASNAVEGTVRSFGTNTVARNRAISSGLRHATCCTWGVHSPFNAIILQLQEYQE